MTAALALILALALWTASAPAAPSSRRVRAVLSSPSRAGARTRFTASPGGWRVPLGWRRRRGSTAPDVSMTVLVHQLAALLKGGRAPARLWEDLGALYDCGPPERQRGGGMPWYRRRAPGRWDRGPGPTRGVLGAASQDILAAARGAAARGSPVAAAIRREAGTVTGRAGSPGAAGKERVVWAELAACFDVAEASGCPRAEVLTRFAAHLEAADDAEAARQTALAGPKATVRILTWLPFLGLGAATLLGVDPSAVLLGTPLGGTALVAGLALTTGGRIWSARLVRAAAGPRP